jgi:putative transposase
MRLQGSLSIERMCQLAGVSRAGFYRSLQERAPVEEDMEVRSVMQQITVEHRRRYGYRRISAELRRRGMLVNHKRVLRIMREDNLLAVQPRTFVVTTDSDHEFEVYLNLASRMKLTGINQLWVADITYIRLQREFVYLAVILDDAFSRKVVGWALDRTLAARLPIAALEQALAQRQPPPGLVHHSDRGVQYASGEYATVLRKWQMIPSMSRPANPYDNASCESFMKTLKREEIYANDYRDLEHLLGNIEAFIEQYYNRCRLHSALGYRSPEQFEREVKNGVNSAGATMSFFRHGEIYQSDVGNSSGERPKSRPPTHRSDESPAVIPRRVALQQSSPPLHQPSVILKEKRKFEKEKLWNGECANSKLSQRRGSPHAGVP